MAQDTQKSVSNLGGAQSEMGRSAMSVGDQMVNDQTQVGDHTWEGLKEFAMQPDYAGQIWYQELTPEAQKLVVSLR